MTTNRGAVQLTIRRTRKRFTKARVGADTGIHPSDIGRMEAGTRKPTIDQAVVLKRELGIPVEWWAQDPSEADLAALRDALGTAPAA